jgi:hypothetical protein
MYWEHELGREAPMRPTNRLSVSAAATDALFASALQRSDEPSIRQVRQAVAAAVRQFGRGGCAGQVAQEFGEHPESAAARMQWARRMVAEAFGEPGLTQARDGQSPHPASRAA